MESGIGALAVLHVLWRLVGWRRSSYREVVGAASLPIAAQYLLKVFPPIDVVSGKMEFLHALVWVVMVAGGARVVADLAGTSGALRLKRLACGKGGRWVEP